jgi:hypothetical protein
MSLIETLEKHVAETKAKIAGCSHQERARIEQINLISVSDERGKTPEVSSRIRQLDVERRNLMDTRRILTADLATGLATLEKARQITKQR